jgi:hypothetical protein
MDDPPRQIFRWDGLLAHYALLVAFVAFAAIAISGLLAAAIAH